MGCASGRGLHLLDGVVEIEAAGEGGQVCRRQRAPLQLRKQPPAPTAVGSASDRLANIRRACQVRLSVNSQENCSLRAVVEMGQHV